jgi:exosortase
MHASMRGPSATCGSSLFFPSALRRDGVPSRVAHRVHRVKRALGHPLALVVAQAAALWPMWQWYARRITDGSDEPWGLVALGTVLLLVGMERDSLRREPHSVALLGAGMLTVLSAVSLPWLPPLARAVLGVSALALTLAAILDWSRPFLPLWGLLLLSLPVVSSLQFYLGYPLRALTAQASSALLNLIGLPVGHSGTALSWNGRTVLVDAPCSGIRMLWAGLFLAALLSCLARASLTRCLFNGMVAFAIILAANVLRNTFLFAKEAGILDLPAWTHSATGLVAFLVAGLLIAGVTRWRSHAR